MIAMPRYEYRGASPFNDNRNDRVIEPGDVVELDAHVADPHPAMVPVPDDEGDEQSEEGDADSLPFDPADKTVDELRDAVADIDDADVLEALHGAEADGKNRDTALDILDA